MTELVKPSLSGVVQGEALRTLTHLARTKNERNKIIKHLPMILDLYKNK